ncbi:MAG: hypothetical protein QOJ40_1611 [Verrucomicrobiota bacterium]
MTNPFSVNPIWRILYRLYRMVSWLRFRMQRRFTRTGLVLTGALVATAIMGPDIENNVTYQAFTLLLFLLLVGMAFTCFFTARFSARRRLPRFGTVGCPFTYRVALRNITSRPQSGLTFLENLADVRPSFNEWHAQQLAEARLVKPFRVSQRHRTHPFRVATLKDVPVPTALPDEEVEVSGELIPLRRGILRFSGMTIARPDPLGLVRAFATIPLSQTALILPRRYPLPPIALPGAMKYQERGVALASNVGQSEEFIGLRDYRHGDPLRHIHWRSWAKVGRPVVKEFEDEFFVRHALVLDTFIDRINSEIFEEAVSVAASFASTIQTQESLLDLLFVGTQSYCFTSGRGLAHADQMLEILASVQPCPGRSFSALEHLVLNHVKVVSGCICVLVAWDEERRAFVEKLLKLGIPLRVMVIASPAAGKKIDPGPLRDDQEKFHVLELGQIEAGLAKLR